MIDFLTNYYKNCCKISCSFAGLRLASDRGEVVQPHLVVDEDVDEGEECEGNDSSAQQPVGNILA